MNQNFMNRTLIIIVIIILVIAGGGFYLFNQFKKGAVDTSMGEQAMMTDDAGSMAGDEAAMEQDDSMNATGDSYVAYSAAQLDQAKDGRRVLFFYASWCPTCRPADADFSGKSSSFPDDLTLIRVNYNDPETDEEEKALADKYNVTYQHTFVQIDNEGNEITKWNGGQTDELLQQIR